MKRESMILLACAAVLLIVPGCRRKDGCGIFTCGKSEKKVEKKAMDAGKKDAMKKKAPKNGGVKKVAKK